MRKNRDKRFLVGLVVIHEDEGRSPKKFEIYISKQV